MSDLLIMKTCTTFEVLKELCHSLWCGSFQVFLFVISGSFLHPTPSLVINVTCCWIGHKLSARTKWSIAFLFTWLSNFNMLFKFLLTKIFPKQSVFVFTESWTHDWLLQKACSKVRRKGEPVLLTQDNNYLNLFNNWIWNIHINIYLLLSFCY